MEMTQEWLGRYQQEISDFSEKIEAFDKGEITRKDYKGMSGGMGSYAQHDGARHMLRLRLPAGRLTKERLFFVAQTVEKYDVGLMKLTTCEALQLHNLTPQQVPEIMEAAIGCGIISRGGGGDNPRNVMASPLSGVQQGECFDVTPWAEAATQYLLSICREIHMPRKLKVAFSNGADDSVHAAFRDMGFTAQQDGTFSLRIAGGLGNNYRMGVLVDGAVAPQDVLYCLKAMIDTFCQHGNYENRAKARTRYMQETLGADGLKTAFLENFKKAKAAGGLDLHLTPQPVAKKGSGEKIEDARVIPQKQDGLYAVQYHPIGGVLPAGKPRALYEAIRELPEAECRVAPDETIYIINLTAAEARRVLAVTDDGARTLFERSVSCIGASVCQQGLRDSQALLRACVEAVRAAGLPDGALPRIRISGCPSSCSGHQAGAIGLQGWSKMVDGKPTAAFKLYLDGCDTLGQEKFGAEAGVVAESDVPRLLVEMGQAAAAAGMDWQTWSREHGDERRAIVEKYV